jgi:hypothetical protein
MNNDAAFKAVWKGAIDYFNLFRGKGYSGLDQADYPDEYHIALICYVLVGFYDKFNKATWSLKDESETMFYPYKAYFKIMCLTIEQMPGTPYTFKPGQKLFRGVGGEVHVTLNQTIAFQHFVSTSLNRDIAEGYSKTDKKRAVFIFDAVVPHSSGLQHHPPTAKNEEVLISPFNAYKVVGIENPDPKEPDYKVIYLQT